MNTLKKTLECVDEANLMMKVTETILEISNIRIETTFSIFQVYFCKN